MKRLALVVACASCDRTAALPPIEPGVRVGGVEIGMRWPEVRALLGEPTSEPTVLVRLGHARWRDAGIDVLLTSPEDARLSDESIVIGVGTAATTSRASIEAEFGEPSEQYDGHDYY